MRNLMRKNRELGDRALKLSMDLISIPSITPAGQEVFRFVGNAISSVHTAKYLSVPHESGNEANAAVFAVERNADRSLCFAGHLDVVPAGAGWSNDPFKPVIMNGLLYGRGAVDMKTSVACFIAALDRAVTDGLQCNVTVILTGDEEKGEHPAMEKIVDDMLASGQSFDLCLVGEPTSNKVLGDRIKVGRRGSIYFDLVVHGKQGHMAYPDNAVNPVDTLPALVTLLNDLELDNGSDGFLPSKLVINKITTDDVAQNVIPGSLSMRMGVRFGIASTPKSMFEAINDLCGSILDNYELTYRVGAQPFISETSGANIDLVSGAVSQVTGVQPQIWNGGGTSDARYLYKVGPVIELGPLNATAHAVDEYISVDDIYDLAEVYYGIICDFFS